MLNDAFKIDLESKLWDLSGLLMCDPRELESVIKNLDESAALVRVQNLLRNVGCDPGLSVRFSDSAMALADRTAEETPSSPNCLAAPLVLLLALADLRTSFSGGSDNDANTMRKRNGLRDVHESLVARYGHFMLAPWGLVARGNGETWLEIDRWKVPASYWFLDWASLAAPATIAQLDVNRCPSCVCQTEPDDLTAERGPSISL